MSRLFIAGLAVGMLSACGSSTSTDSAAPQPETGTPKCAAYDGPVVDSLHHYEGTMHEHSAYSDGDIHSIPADFYAQVRDAGFSFVGGSDHSDSLDTGVFISLGNDCFTTPDGLLTCLTPSVDALIKWQSTANQASEISTPDFLAIRGFEWTSDRFGHINVYFSKNFSNAKTDLGYLVTMETFWQWFGRDADAIGLGGSITAPVPFGGGGDGLAHFNHPSDKCLSDGDPGCNWNDFALVPSAVERMFGMELYNTGNGDDRYLDEYIKALDSGWRLSPVGSEDEHGLEYGAETRAKTVTVASSLDEAGFREAWLARRTYALSPGRHLRANLKVDHQAPMGAQLECPAAAGAVALEVSITQVDGTPFVGEYHLFTSDGVEFPVITGSSARFDLPVELGATRWYAVRVHEPGGESVAYLAPVWLSDAAGGATR